MQQADVPEDFVLATGTAYRIGDFGAVGFEHEGLKWQDDGVRLLRSIAPPQRRH